MTFPFEQGGHLRALLQPAMDLRDMKDSSIHNGRHCYRTGLS